MSSDATTITKLYEQIPLEAMQQVADSYMSWYVEKATSELDATIARLRAELEENDKQEALFKPSAAELDSMRRLQSNKVNDVALLDRLVEQGEDWLVLTMQRLDYFERAGLAPHDYPGWCEHALSGAYDWIDAGRLHASKRMFSLQGGATGPMRAVRPSDLAAIKSEATGPVRSAEPAAPRAPSAPAPQPQHTEPVQPKTAPAARAPEKVDPSTQPVPVILQPAPAATSANPEQVAKIETAPLPPPAARSDAPRQSAPQVQAIQRPPAQAASPLADTPTRPTPVAPPIQEMPVPPRQKPAAPPASPSAAPAQQRPATAAPAAGTAPTLQAPQRPAPSVPPGANMQPGQPQTQQRRPEQPPVVAARPPQPTAQPSGPMQQPQAGQKQRPAPNWYQEPQSDPRYSLDDVEIDDLDEEGDDQGLLRKIFRVFTG